MSSDEFPTEMTHTGIILIGEANQCLIFADIKGCHVRDWIMGK